MRLFFLYREDWIRGPKTAADVQRLVWFTDGSRTEERTEVAICGPRKRLLFCLSKEICKVRIWKRAPRVGSWVGET